MVVRVTPSITNQIISPDSLSLVEIDPVEVSLDSEPIESDEDIRDLELTEVLVNFFRQDSQINFYSFSPNFPISYQSLDTDIATVDSSGYVTTVIPGSVDILVQQKHIKRRVSHVGFVGEGVKLNRFRAFKSGTLGQHIVNQVASRLASEGQVATTVIVEDEPIYNTNCWAADLDFSGASYANLNSDPSATRHRNSLTMITPRHGMAVRHSGGGPNVGHVLQFLDNENVIHERTVTHVRTWGSPRDMRMCQLNSDLPSTVKNYKLLPSNWRDYLSVLNNSGMMFVFRSQYRRAQVRYWQRQSSGALDEDGYFIAVSDLDDTFFPLGSESPSLYGEAFNHTAYGRNLGSSEIGEPIYGAWLNPGNSGHPFFVVINGELILMSCNVTGFNGNAFPLFINEFNEQIDTWGSSYTVQTIDLSSFAF